MSLPATAGIPFGGDYNPEQWPDEVWAQDYQRFDTARINTVTVGVFTWVATLGLGSGIFPVLAHRHHRLPAWLMHRGYHVLAVPSWERKIRVLAIWLTAALSGRDVLSLASVQHPREAFVAGGEPAALSRRRRAPTWHAKSQVRHRAIV